MRPFTKVVSWLAAGFFVWRGVILSFAWLAEVFGSRVTHLSSTGGPLSIHVSTSVKGVLPWGMLWIWPILAILAPWLPRILQRCGIVAPGRSPDESVLEAWNLVGRWAFLLLVLLSRFGFPAESIEFLVLNPGAQSVSAALWAFGIPVLLLLAVLLVAPEVTSFAASRFTRFADNVFFPGDRETTPPYTLKLARHYVSLRRWVAAENEFARVLEWHPTRREAWQERLALAFERDDSEEPTPEDVLAWALRALPDVAEKAAVHETYAARAPLV